MLKLPNNTTGNILKWQRWWPRVLACIPLPLWTPGVLLATGQPLCRGLSSPVQVSLEVEFTEGSSFLLSDRPSVFSWMSGLGTDPMTEEQELRGKPVALRWELWCPLRAQVQKSHPPLRTLLPTWARARGGCASCLARTLSSQDQPHSAPCWTQTSSSPSSHHGLLEGLPHTCRRVILMSLPRAVEWILFVEFEH